MSDCQYLGSCLLGWHGHRAPTGTCCSGVTCHLHFIWVHGGLLDPLAVGCEDKEEECDAKEGTKARSDPLSTSHGSDSMG